MARIQNDPVIEFRPSRHPVKLASDQAVRLSHAVGSRIQAREGALWVTQEHDPRDVVLGPGDSFVVDRPGLVLVLPLSGEASVSVA